MDDLVKASDPIIHHTFDAGEGVLIPGEILHHAAHGCRAFVILQPFGCLPNHVVGRGIVKKLKEIYPDAQILPLDYDPDVSFANVENPLQMLVINVKGGGGRQDGQGGDSGQGGGTPQETGAQGERRSAVSSALAGRRPLLSPAPRLRPRRHGAYHRPAPLRSERAGAVFLWADAQGQGGRIRGKDRGKRLLREGGGATIIGRVYFGGRGRTSRKEARS